MSRLLSYGVNTNLSGVNGFGRQPANSSGSLVGIYTALLAATTDTTLTVPNAIAPGNLASDLPNALAVINYQDASNVFVALGATAAPNGTGAFVASNGVLKPTALLVKGGSVLHFYALAQAYVSVEFYSIT